MQLRFLVAVCALLLAGCQAAPIAGSSPPPPGASPAPVLAAGEPTDEQVKSAVEAKGCITAPDPGTHAACISVDGYSFSAISRHGRRCQVINRISIPSYPITMVVTATGHYQDGLDREFSLPDASTDTAVRAFMFVYSETYKAWGYNITRLSDAGACSPA